MSKGAYCVNVRTWVQVPQIHIKRGCLVQTCVTPALLGERRTQRQENPRSRPAHLAYLQQKEKKKSQKDPVLKRGRRQGLTSKVVLWPLLGKNNLSVTQRNTWTKYQVRPFLFIKRMSHDPNQASKSQHTLPGRLLSFIPNVRSSMAVPRGLSSNPRVYSQLANLESGLKRKAEGDCRVIDDRIFKHFRNCRKLATPDHTRSSNKELTKETGGGWGQGVKQIPLFLLRIEVWFPAPHGRSQPSLTPVPGCRRLLTYK